MRATLLLPLMLLAGCAAGPTKSVAPISDAALNTLYARIDAATARFDTAVARYEQGDAAAAATEFGAARAELRQIADECLEQSGCDVRRVLAAQDALLLRQGRYLVGATEDADPVNGNGDLVGEGGSPVLLVLPQSARTVAMLNGTDLAKVIELNEPVKAAMEEWLTWMRPQLLDTWENYQYMRHRMFPEYEKTGLPEALLFGIMAKESGGRVHAVSRAGAAGPLQFMPATGARFGLNRGGSFDLRFDPAESTRANAAYLNERFAELNGNLALALAAYNGGEGRIARLSNKGAKDFWSPQVFNALPAETREYVPMVLAAAWLFLHPERYNLSFAQYDASPVSITLKQEMSINELSVCIGQHGNPRGWFRHLRNLNARWEAGRRLPVGTELELPAAALEAYLRQCQDGPMLAMSRELHDARPPVAPSVASRATGGGSYTIRKGDSLHGIAHRHGCTVQGLANTNGIRAPKYLIKPGQRLSLSGCSRR
ncbi:transglycosylase SLT domain-containing protein [Xanthomonadaceae bacterium JHOS43]|nr:transglycosylase SLT domain-containing protein [Xanthomonadaceae bacterium JHOS43]